MNNINLWIAIPDSALIDEQTKRDKSVKISQFARACSIFRVKRIYIYHDSIANVKRQDSNLIKIILRYLDTPQYLRKFLYPRLDELEYAGILHPIKAPHHKHRQNIKDVRPGEIRTGVVIKIKGKLFVDAGLGTPIKFEGRAKEGNKINVKFVSPYPNISAIEARKDEIKEYWGYDVYEVSSLEKLLTEVRDAQIIITSKSGTFFKNKEEEMIERFKSINNVLVIFGSPKHGVPELFSYEHLEISKFEFILNTFPNQGTETVRLEEAMLGTLTLINHILSK